MCVSVLSACIHVHHMCAWCPHRSEEAFDPLKLDLCMVVSHPWVLGTEPRSSAGAISKSGSHLQAISPVPCLLFHHRVS